MTHEAETFLAARMVGEEDHRVCVFANWSSLKEKKTFCILVTGDSFTTWRRVSVGC